MLKHNLLTTRNAELCSDPCQCQLQPAIGNLPSNKEPDMQCDLQNIGRLLVVLFSLAQIGFAQEKASKATPRTAPLTVTGKALDETGKPLKGATIYLVSTNGSPAKTIGQITTGDDGKYEFRDA